MFVHVPAVLIHPSTDVGVIRIDTSQYGPNVSGIHFIWLSPADVGANTLLVTVKPPAP
jgi:hypothetical protein